MGWGTKSTRAESCSSRTALAPYRLCSLQEKSGEAFTPAAFRSTAAAAISEPASTVMFSGPPTPQSSEGPEQSRGMQFEIASLRAEVRELSQLVREHVVTGRAADRSGTSFKGKAPMANGSTPLSSQRTSELGPEKSSFRRTVSEDDHEIKKALSFVTKHQAEEIFGSRDGFGSAAFDTARNSARHSLSSGNKKRRVWMVHPASNFRYGWDLTTTVLICFIAITLPFRIAFVEAWSLAWVVTDFLFDLWFIFDILLNFLTRYIDASGKVVFSRRLVALRCAC